MELISKDITELEKGDVVVSYSDSLDRILSMEVHCISYESSDVVCDSGLDICPNSQGLFIVLKNE